MTARLNQAKLRIPVRVSYVGVLQGFPTKHGHASGEDLPALVRDAAKFAGAQINDLYFRSVPANREGIILEAWTKSGSAADGLHIDIGPMAGPAHPSILATELGYSWAVFWPHVEYETNEYRHLAQVRVTNVATPPRRLKNESDEEFACRLVTFQEQDAALAAKAGWHVVEYPIQPRYWSAADLEHVIARFLRLVPIESFWRVTLTQNEWRHRNTQASRWQWILEISTYKYEATLRLPIFPTSALVDWLAEQNAEVTFKPNLQRLRILADAPDPDIRTRPATRSADDIGFKPTVVQGGVSSI